jgi:acylphosphatase
MRWTQWTWRTKWTGFVAVDIQVVGRVQGVGFRWYVKGLADRIGVTGEVWNRRDGSVGALAHHPDADVLAEFVEALRQGPGRVDSVWTEPSVLAPEGPFHIGATR